MCILEAWRPLFHGFSALTVTQILTLTFSRVLIHIFVPAFKPFFSYPIYPTESHPSKIQPKFMVHSSSEWRSLIHLPSFRSTMATFPRSQRQRTLSLPFCSPVPLPSCGIILLPHPFPLTTIPLLKGRWPSLT